MTPERLQPEYFANFRSEEIPECTWQELLSEGKAISPSFLVRILEDAKKFLITEAGPNLGRRQFLVPKWLDYWIDWLSAIRSEEYGATEFVRSERLVPFESVKRLLEETGQIRNSGVLFLAGGEGHPGHVFAANYMRRKWVDYNQLFSVWAFEQEPYLAKKPRGGIVFAACG